LFDVVPTYLQAKRDIDQKATSGRDVESTATQRGCAHWE